MRDWTMGTGITLFAAGLLASAPGTLTGQEEAERDEEHCVCVTEEALDDVRTNADRIRRMVLSRMGSRARLGIALGGGEEAAADGVAVEEVIDGSPAQAAGLREGDVIVAVGGHRLTQPLPDPGEEDDLDGGRSLPAQRLVALIGDHEPGDDVEVTFRRDGEERAVTAELDRASPGWRFLGRRAPGAPGAPGHEPPPRPRHQLREGAPDAPHRPRARRMRTLVAPSVHGFRSTEACRELAGSGVVPARDCVAGLEVRTLNEGLSAYFGADEGVVVLEVAEGSTLGLRPGDVVLSVDGREVEDEDDLRRILRSYEEGEDVAFRVHRRDRRIEVTGTMP